MSLVVSFGMYDWPEAQAANDAAWADIRPVLHAAGLAAPARLVRRNRDLPPVPGGIRGPGGRLLAPDPAQLAPDDLDFTAVWHHPALLLAEICHGVLDHNSFPGRERVGQLDYDGIDGCSGAAYSSALICRPENAARMRDARARSFADLVMAFNSEDSLSGIMALRDDLAQQGRALADEARLIATGSHRQSVRAVITGSADFASIDARSWSLARDFEPGAARLTVFGFTRKRTGIALIAPSSFASTIREALKGLRNRRGKGPFGVQKAGDTG